MEKDIEQYLRKKIKAKGGLALKFTSPGMTGVPDRLILLPGGECYFVELKSDIGKVSKRQEYVHKQFRALGFKVYIINSKNQVDDL